MSKLQTIEKKVDTILVNKTYFIEHNNSMNRTMNNLKSKLTKVERNNYNNTIYYIRFIT